MKSQSSRNQQKISKTFWMRARERCFKSLMRMTNKDLRKNQTMKKKEAKMELKAHKSQAKILAKRLSLIVIWLRRECKV